VEDGVPLVSSWFQAMQDLHHQQGRHLEDYLLDLSSRHHDHTPGKMISAATVARHYRSLQQLFRWLKHEEEITHSPFAKMSPPAVPE
jgi:site-specific recombinase XerD